MTNCSVQCCLIRDSKTTSTFSLPNTLGTRIKWLEFLRKSGKIVHENVSYKICEYHFAPSDIKQNGKRKVLINGSVPRFLLGKVKQIVKLNVQK